MTCCFSFSLSLLIIFFGWWSFFCSLHLRCVHTYTLFLFVRGFPQVSGEPWLFLNERCRCLKKKKRWLETVYMGGACNLVHLCSMVCIYRSVPMPGEPAYGEKQVGFTEWAPPPLPSPPPLPLPLSLCVCVCIFNQFFFQRYLDLISYWLLTAQA